MEIRSDLNLKDRLTNKKSTTLIFSILIFLTTIIFRPFNMDLNQSIILATLLMVLVWWTTSIVNRTYASIFLLIMFSIFGLTPVMEIFKFPLSSNFYMIALSFLLSQGIVNSNVANRLSRFILDKYGNTPYKLIFISFLFPILLIFIIPQSFSRVIILASIYKQFFTNLNLDKETEEILYFSVFLVSAITCMMFLNGDIILNYAVLQFAGLSMGWIDWFKYMALPTFLTTVLVGLAFIFYFKDNLMNMDLKKETNLTASKKMGSREKAAIVIMALVIILWMTEPIHSISPTLVTLGGTLAMFGFKIIGLKDLKSLNLDLLIFLTAAFAIGSVMNESGVANIIYSRMLTVFPSNFSYTYLLILSITVMALHMLLGSSITTLSVVIPILIPMTKGVLNPIALAFLIYIIVNMHFILPFHNITIMIGAGNDYYSNKVVIRYGVILTVLVFVAIFAFYIPWWKFIKLI